MVSYKHFVKEGIVEIGNAKIEKSGDTILLKKDGMVMKFVQVNRRHYNQAVKEAKR
jgi:hypothetical protein